MANTREDSRKNWDSAGTREDINSGSLQRIADATELIAQRYSELIADVERYKRWYAEEKQRRESRDNQIRSLKGVITKPRKAGRA
jgi:hypothetical protein